MNPLTQLAVLIAELHAEIYQLRAENEQLKEQVVVKRNRRKQGNGDSKK